MRRTSVSMSMRVSAAIILIGLPVTLPIGLGLAGCAGGGAVTGSPSATRGAAPEPMGGRWQLAAPGSSQCVMTLGGAPSDSKGTIAPQGGCPGNFYTSRKWSYELGSLVIR